jgi:hypothetical protein
MRDELGVTLEENMKHRRKENDGRGNKSGYQIEEFC